MLMSFLIDLIIRPVLKEGLCMSAGQKKNFDVAIVSKFDIRDVWLIQPYFRVGKLIKWLMMDHWIVELKKSGTVKKYKVRKLKVKN